MPAPSYPRPITVPTTKKPKCNCELCSATVGKPKKSDPFKNPSNIKRPRRQTEKFDDIPCIKPVKKPAKPVPSKHDCGVVLASEWYREPPDPSRCCSKNSRRQEDNKNNDAPCCKKKTDIIRRDTPRIKPVPVPSTDKNDSGVVLANEWYREPPDPSRCCSKNSRRQEDGEDDDAPCRKKKKPIKPDIIRRNKLAVKILSKRLQAVKSLLPPCDSRYETVQLFPTATHVMRWAPAYSLARTRSQTCNKKPKKKKEPPPPPPPKEPIDVNEKSRNCACELMANAIRKDLTHHLGLSEQRNKINETPVPSLSKVSEIK